MKSLLCASTGSPPVKFINYELYEWVSFRKRFLDCWRPEKGKVFQWRGLFNVRIKNCRSLQRKGILTENFHSVGNELFQINWQNKFLRRKLRRIFLMKNSKTLTGTLMICQRFLWLNGTRFHSGPSSCLHQKW